MSKLALSGALLGLIAAAACHPPVHGSAPLSLRPEPAAVAAIPLEPSAVAVTSWEPVTPPGLTSVDATRALAPGGDAEPTPQPPLPACIPDQKQSCTFNGRKGLQQCEHDGQWSECGLVAQCSPGQRRSCGDASRLPYMAGRCTVNEGRWVFHRCDTPLVLSFDRAPVTFTDAPGSFDLRADGSPPTASRWVSPATPWLALDLDHSGAIEDARELFGSASVLPSGARAHHGFEALAAHDDDHDGWITPRDAIWAALVLWSDTDQDRRSSPDELAPLSSRGLTGIAVSFTEQPRCERGACEVERATFRFVDAEGHEREGAVVDVHFDSR